MVALLKRLKDDMLGERKEHVCITVDVFCDNLTIIKNNNCSSISKKVMDYISKKHGLESGLASFDNLSSEAAQKICDNLILLGLVKVVHKDHTKYKKYTLKGEMTLKELKSKINNQT